MKHDSNVKHFLGWLMAYGLHCILYQHVQYRKQLFPSYHVMSPQICGKEFYNEQSICMISLSPSYSTWRNPHRDPWALSNPYQSIPITLPLQLLLLYLWLSDSDRAIPSSPTLLYGYLRRPVQFRPPTLGNLDFLGAASIHNIEAITTKYRVHVEHTRPSLK